MRVFSFLASISAVCALVIAADIPEPQNDPFYFPDISTYENAKPGTILNHRKVDVPEKLKCTAEIYQILYRTTNTNGTAAATVTTVLVPINADNTKLASYQVAEDSAYIACAPSYDIVTNGGDSFVQALVDGGTYVNVPDYEGPQSAFGAGILSGQATLDSIRAVLASGEFTGISNDVKVAMTGYSGGSIATGWAAQLQPTYASDLPIVGAAVGGFVTNLTAVLEYIDSTIAAGFIPTAVAGLATQYPDFAELVTQEIKPQYVSALEFVTTHCMADDLLHFPFTDIFTYLKSGRAFLQNPIVQKMLEQNTMGETPPKIPLYVHQGLIDEIVPVKIVDETVAQYCQEGASVEYWVNPVAEHILQQSEGVPYALKWVADRLKGLPVSNGCSSSTKIMPSLGLATGSCPSSVLTSSSSVVSSTSVGSSAAISSEAVSSTIPASSTAAPVSSTTAPVSSTSSAAQISTSVFVVNSTTVAVESTSTVASTASSSEPVSSAASTSTSAIASSSSPTSLSIAVNVGSTATVVVTKEIQTCPSCKGSHSDTVQVQPTTATEEVDCDESATSTETLVTCESTAVYSEVQMSVSKNTPAAVSVPVTSASAKSVPIESPSSFTQEILSASSTSTAEQQNPVPTETPVGVVSGSDKITVSLSVLFSCLFGMALI